MKALLIRDLRLAVRAGGGFGLGLAIGFVVGHRVGARADHAHAALQYVDELGEFIQRGATQEGAQGRNADIVGAGLGHGVAVFANTHGAKLVHQDALPIEPVAVLAEHHRAR